MTKTSSDSSDHDLFVTEFPKNDFGIVDCSLAPILWRLPEYKINLPKSAEPILKYADRLFERKSFLENLSEQEEDIRSTY